MKKIRKKAMDVNYETRTLPAGLIVAQSSTGDWDKKELKNRTAYFAINSAPTISVNEVGNARFKLLTAELDFHAARAAGHSEFPAHVYKFSEKNAEAFSLIEQLKSGGLGAMDEAYMMEKLIKNHNLTQNDIAAMIGKSRPAVANTLRLLTLHPEVIGMVESGRLSAGHARTLVKVPQEKQRPFAEEGLKRKFSVREMERAVKAFLTPPEILRKEKEAKTAANNEQLKALVERMRVAFGTKVSLIGNDKKGRIYIDYYSAEDLLRIELAVGVKQPPDEQISMFDE